MRPSVEPRKTKLIEPAKLLTDLLSYIVEQAREINPDDFRVGASKLFKRERQQLEGLPGVHLDHEPSGDHKWLMVERLSEVPPPTPEVQQSLRAFFKIPNDPDRKPSIDIEAGLAKLSPSVRDDQPAALAQLTSAREALALYLPHFENWAAEERPRRRVIALYGEMFALISQLKSSHLAKALELVWGVGVSSWNLSYRKRATDAVLALQYPLLTQVVEIGINERTLAIEVRPGVGSARLEFDALAFCQVPGVAEAERSAKLLLSSASGGSINPFARSTFEPILKLAAGSLHEKGRYAEQFDGLPMAGSDLLITDAWLLFCRPRTNNLLVEDIERLKSRITAGDPIPAGSLALVTTPSDEKVEFASARFRGLCGTSGTSGPVKDLYFPLPYNREQVTIIEQLERSDGAAVQGPPGTGKTHTIANVVCHYLATGKRVLVTSRGEQALQVLQDKIPEAVRPLAVALLAGDRAGMQQFQNAIETILHTVSNLNPVMAGEEIAKVRADIDGAHRELAALDHRVDEIAHAQLSDLDVDGVQMRAARMAELVVEGAQQHDWFKDKLSLDARHAIPFTDSELAEIRERRRRIGRDLDQIRHSHPLVDKLPTAAQIGALHAAKQEAKSLRADLETGAVWPLRPTDRGLEARAKLLDLVTSMHSQLHELNGLKQPWLEGVREKLAMPFYAAEAKALYALTADAERLAEARAEFLQRPVDLPAEALSSPKTLEAIEKAAETGKPFGMFALGAAESKAHIAAVRVAGLAPTSSEGWAHVRRYVRLHEQVLSFAARWRQIADPLGLPAINGGVIGLREVEMLTTASLKLLDLVEDGDASLPRIAKQVFKDPKCELGRAGVSDLEELQRQLAAHDRLEALAYNANALHAIESGLSAWTSPITHQLRRFFSVTLGDPAIPTDVAVSQYMETLAEVRRIENLVPLFEDLQDDASDFHDAGAEALAQRVLTVGAADAGDDPVLPHTLRQAWLYSRLASHLEGIEARAELIALSSRRRELERSLARHYVDLAAKSAWLSTKLNASARVLSALETYKTAIRRIGQGTGVNAARHRKDAQEAMLLAQGAIPCWVMSHMKVSETLPSVLGAFDLVVVDEASQSDLAALPAVLRGKKILIVGDAKQTSPTEGFVASTRIQELRDRFLTGQPHAPLLTQGSSLYDLAATIFADSKSMLVEHFRCVPSIIGYSNRFYAGAMQPLRLPKQSERLDPPLIDVYVADGYRDKDDINLAELEFIVQEIAALLEDPRYAGRTIGVVSLLGSDQAKEIDTRVRARFDAQDLLNRDFLSGDPRVFQGSERDIIFLTLVADRKNCKALSGNMYDQRFNVAASRARDRMYLVRSVTLADLSPSDIRRGLLEHFASPLVSSDPVDGNDLSRLCDSGFEVEVYKRLCDLGYRVTPQVKAAGFKIDLVVEGGQDNRLAIELDGDAFHGPDRWPADMARQRILERAGWTFWRCFASTWTMRKEKVMNELVERLTAMGIEPLGFLAGIPALVEFRQVGGIREAEDTSAE